MTFIQKLKILIGRNLISSATGRWYPKYPVEAYFHNCMSFSQCGEDLAVVNVLMQLGHQGPVNYVDIGCFHPIQYSNSYFFYLREGSGLVVDMNESHRSEFERLRPRDIFVPALVSDSSEPLFVDLKGRPTDSIVDKNLSKSSISMKPTSLLDLLDKHWPKNKELTLLDIDCEEHDIDVLKSNNWSKYRPRVVVVEDFSMSENNVIQKYMQEVNYSLILRFRNSALYQNNITGHLSEK